MKNALALSASVALFALALPHGARAQTSVNAACPSGTQYPLDANRPLWSSQLGLCFDGTNSFSGGIPPYAATTVGTDQLGQATSSVLTPIIPATAKYCVFTSSVAAVNYRSDGTNPAAGSSGGMPLGVGLYLVMAGPSLSTVKFINASAASGALLSQECYK